MEKPIYLDMTQYKRINHFNYFKSLAFPYVGITSDVDITKFYHWVKKNQLPFFLSFLWCVSRAANGVEEFRQRIIQDKIVEYPFCRTSHTVAKEDGTYSYCMLDERMEFRPFIEHAALQQENARLHGSIEEEDTESLLFISTIPWLTYTSLIQPMTMPADSNPRITWGKFYEREASVCMPVSVLCHHALVDGKHIAAFYKLLSDVMEGTIKEEV